MEVRVVKTFADKETYKMYAIGEKILLPDERAKDVIKRGLATAITAKAENKQPIEEVVEKPKRKPIKKKVNK